MRKGPIGGYVKGEKASDLLAGLLPDARFPRSFHFLTEKASFRIDLANNSDTSQGERKARVKHAFILHGSLNAGTLDQLLNFEPPIDEVTVSRLSNDRLSEDDVLQLPKNPTLVLYQPFQCEVIPAVFGRMVGRKFVTPKMRDYLEQLEPGVHRFFPIQVRSEIMISGKKDHGEHYLLLPPPLIDCLVIETTQFAKGYGIEGWKQGKNENGGGGLSGRPNSPCTLQKSLVEGHHLWRTKVGDRFEYTCSDEFWEGIETEWQIWEPHTQCSLCSDL